MRSTALLLLAASLLAGCANGRFRSREILPGQDDPTRPTDPSMSADPDAWTIRVDTSGTARYLERAEATATVRGTVEASLGAERAEVDGTDTPLDARDQFSATAPVPEGLSLLEVHGFDVAGNSGRGDRAILRADYLPEGEMDSNAIAIAVDDALLSGLAAGALAGAGGGLDSLSLSSFITPGTAIVSGSPCTIYVDSITHSPPTIALSTTADGRLRATARVNDIAVAIHGNCSALGTDVEIRRGSEVDETNVEITMILEPTFPAPGECADGLRASEPSVAITALDLDLRLGGCGLLCLAGELVGELAEGFVRDMLEDQVSGMIGPAIGPALEGVSLLETTTTMDFLSTPVEVSLCMTGLDSSTGVLVATMGVIATGPGGETDAPGAPRLPATSGALPSGTLAIDPSLVGQILFSAWRGGALRIDSLGAGGGGPTLNVDLLAGVVPALRDLIGTTIPRGSPLTVGIDAAMAPLVRAPNAMERAAGADFVLELGDLRLTLGAAGRELFVLSSTVRLGLSLEPNAEGALVPTLVRAATSTDTHVAETTVPSMTARMGEALSGLVNGLVPAQIAPLLEGAAIRLPDLGTPLTVTGVEPDAGGTLHVSIATGP